jgi:hypothetical protein
MKNSMSKSIAVTEEIVINKIYQVGVVEEFMPWIGIYRTRSGNVVERFDHSETAIEVNIRNLSEYLPECEKYVFNPTEEDMAQT